MESSWIKTLESNEQRILDTREITEEVINFTVEKIVKALDPEKVMVFGSAAGGEPETAHDLDILIVMESSEPPHLRRAMVSRILRGRSFPLDPHVLTPEELKQALDAGNTFVEEIITTGKVLYEKRKS